MIPLIKDKKVSEYTSAYSSELWLFEDVSKDEYLKVENSSFLSRLHKGSIKHFVASLADSDDLTNDDIDELENLLKQLKVK